MVDHVSIMDGTMESGTIYTMKCNEEQDICESNTSALLCYRS